MSSQALSSSDWLTETETTDSLIESALQAVRDAARLDDDPVLPPLPPRTPRREVMVLSRADLPLPSPSEIVRASAALPSPAVSAPALASPRRGLRWPVLICGCIASLAAGAALVASPVGHSPRVQHVLSAIVHAGGR